MANKSMADLAPAFYNFISYDSAHSYFPSYSDLISVPQPNSKPVPLPSGFALNIYSARKNLSEPSPGLCQSQLKFHL